MKLMRAKEFGGHLIMFVGHDRGHFQGFDVISCTNSLILCL